ncbi:hypothetical protein [Hydrogenoanaerobacterium sp.]|uniref:hypothetical protein n=1 Tax=Hydrogenoanaerobacterium sp. TaxID=2953763 RepID=UPI0028963443|nr:hypothetical protein [Hydrogenoanaerobacterium sp.]
MKRFLFFCVCIACLLPVTAFAASITDDFASAQGDTWRSYSNLVASKNNVAVDVGWPSAPDATALSLSSPANPSFALYAVSGAQSVSVSIYSIFSTAASKSGGIYRLGYGRGSDLSHFYRPQLSKGGDGMYLYTPDLGWQTMHLRERDFLFVFNPGEAPSEDTAAYGLSISCSADNKSFSPASPVLNSIRSAAEEGGDYGCYYETYSCPIPAGTRYIRLELREMRSFALAGGGTTPNTSTGSMRLAQASFIGSDVTEGSLSAPSSESEPQPSSSSTDPDLQRPVGGKTSTKRVSNQDSSESKSEVSSSRAASSSRSERASKASSSKQEVKLLASIETVVPMASDPSSEYTPPRLQEETTPDSSNKAMLFGGIYIVGAVFALAFVAKRK